jgi:peptidoglycan hydrolase-like protein with peptidoglycan-binding domain
MPKTISSAVGRGGRNFPASDVMTVQYLLNCVPAARGGPVPELAVDGAVGPKTIAAIEKFQRSLGGFADGRVDPGGATLRALQVGDPYPGQSLPAQTAKTGSSAPGQKAGSPAGKSGQFPAGGVKGGQYPPAGKGGQYPPGAKGGQFPGGGKGAGNDPFGQKGGSFPPGGMPPGQWPGAKGGNGGGAKGF